MAKKIAPVIFAGIVLFGIVLGIVGFALGGRPGNFQIDDSQIVYRENGQQVVLANIPEHWFNIPRWFHFWPFNRGDNSYEYDYEYSGEAYATAETPAKPAVPVPVLAGDLQRLEIDVSAGDVVVQPGTEFGLTVTGDLPYRNEYNNGVWTLKTDDTDWGLDVDWAEENLTTFVFTVPATFAELDIELDMGEATVRDITVEQAECNTDLGAIVTHNLTVDNTAKFETDMGSIEMNNMRVRECEITCSMGSVSLTGEVTQKLVADCDMGSIEGTLVRPADYGWDIQADMGSATLDNHSASGMGSSNEGNPGAATFFDLECGMGSIDIQFANVTQASQDGAYETPAATDTEAPATVAPVEVTATDAEAA